MRRYCYYFALENKLRAVGYPIDRKEAVFSFTGGRTSSLRELSHIEYTSLTQEMRGVLAKSVIDQSNVMRRKVISLFRKMGWEKEGKADMKAIYCWVEKYGVHHKSLNTHTIKELASLVSQVEKMYEKHVSSIVI